MDDFANRDGQRLRQLCVVALLALTGASLTVTPSAIAAGDPVARGSLHLKLSSSFRDQLAANEVVVKPKAFSLKDGTIDPVTGSGTLALKGNLRFEHRGAKVVFTKVTARLGSNGVLRGKLKGKTLKLFELRGAKTTRNGFGAEIKGVTATFVAGAARKINRKLGLGSLHAGRAGTVTVSEQPQTVEVTGGSVRLVPDSNLGGPGNVASKMDAHCIAFVSGNTAIAPAVKDSHDVSNPFYRFPVSGGTISPAGTDGEVISAGGIQIENHPDGGPSDTCQTSPPPLANLQQTGLSYNLLKNYLSSHVVINQISGTVPTAGDRGIGIGAKIDAANATVSADPENHTVSVSGLVVRVNAGSALYLNSTFLQPSYNPAAQFASGDLLGRVDLTVTTR